MNTADGKITYYKPQNSFLNGENQKKVIKNGKKSKRKEKEKIIHLYSENLYFYIIIWNMLQDIYLEYIQNLEKEEMLF